MTEGSPGEAGGDSPRTAVLGRKREAMMTLWCLSELIADDGEEEEEIGRVGRFEQRRETITLIGDVTCSALRAVLRPSPDNPTWLSIALLRTLGTIPLHFT